MFNKLQSKIALEHFDSNVNKATLNVIKTSVQYYYLYL